MAHRVQSESIKTVYDRSLIAVPLTKTVFRGFSYGRQCLAACSGDVRRAVCNTFSQLRLSLPGRTTGSNPQKAVARSISQTNCAWLNNLDTPTKSSHPVLYRLLPYRLHSPFATHRDIMTVDSIDIKLQQ